MIRATESTSTLGNFFSSGSGSVHHFAGELFKLQTGVDLLHVPYKGSSQATTDLMAGRISLLFASQLLGQVRAGKVRGLAVTSLKRASALPDLPTIDESGVGGFEVINWFGVAAPPATPGALIGRLHGEIKRALANTDIRARLASEGSEVVATSSAEFRAFLARDVEKWSRVVKNAHIRAD